MDTITKVNATDPRYTNLPHRPYALIGLAGSIVEMIHAQGADAAKQHFDSKYPNRKSDGQQIWLLLGGEDS